MYEIKDYKMQFISTTEDADIQTNYGALCGWDGELHRVELRDESETDLKV